VQYTLHFVLEIEHSVLEARELVSLDATSLGWNGTPLHTGTRRWGQSYSYRRF